MNHFPVWLRSLGNCCKVKVDGQQNVEWLQATLTSQGVECTEAVPVAGTDRYVFRAIYTTRMPPSELQRFLSSRPEVQLMLEPA
jgi:hypothetical protein